MDAIQAAKKIPSFTSASSGSAPTISLTGEETSVYDSNGVLSNFSFTDGSGAEFYKSGNTLYITQTGTISSSTVYRATRYLPSAASSTYNLWYMSGSSYQTTVSLASASSGNLNAYFKLKAPDPGAISLTKTTEDGQNLSGWRFGVYINSACTSLAAGPYTTNSSGKISITGLTAGTSTIVRYLADERYTGTYIIGKRAVLEVGGNNSRFKDRSKWYIIPDHHPAIVDKALFDKVQETVHRFSQPHKKQRDYLLKGIVFCGCCDHALSYVANKQPYFHCRRSQAAENGPCHDLKVDAEELEQVIFQTIKAQLEAVLSIREDGSISLDTVVAERTEYEKQIEALEDSKQSLFEQYIMGEIDVETYKSEKAACDAPILKAKNAYAAITAQAKKKKEELNRQSSRTEAAKAITDAESLTPELVNLLIEKVYVSPGKRIEIAYKVQDLFD